MTESQPIPRPSAIWKQLSAGRRRQASEAFWRDPDGANEQAEATVAIAQRLKFRTKSVVGLPKARKAQYLLDLPAVSESIAARLIVSYHVEHQRPMMSAFLDALGVAHDNGMMAEGTVIPQDAEKIGAAVKAIATSFPAEDVELYLSTLRWQDPETWGVLDSLAN